MNSRLFSLVVVLLHIGVIASAKVFYVSPSGSDSNTGTKESPFFTLNVIVAKTSFVAGDTIYMRGGTYNYGVKQGIKVGNNGVAGNLKKIYAYPGEEVIVDFTTCTDKGIEILGDYWHLRGITIQRVNERGLKIGGNYNFIQNCVFRYNNDSGMQISVGGNTDSNVASHNTVLNCDSYYNYDDKAAGANADGFACKLGPGTDNLFRGCRSWNNADDGFDFYETIFPIFVDSCWVWHNGDYTIFADPSYPYSKINANATAWKGNGNGIKVGGNNNHAEDIVSNCVVFDHKYTASNNKGFDQNHNLATNYIYNCLAWDNEYNYMFYEAPNDGKKHVFRNNVAFAPITANTNIIAGSVEENNSWNLSLSPSADDYISLSVTDAMAPRNVDGSLPKNGFARLKQGSQLIDKGIGVGLPYFGVAPDLGPFESNFSTSINNQTESDAVVYQTAAGKYVVVFEIPIVEQLKVKIYSSAGKIIFDGYAPQSATLNGVNIDLSVYPSGLYICSFDVYGNSKSLKLIK